MMLAHGEAPSTSRAQSEEAHAAPGNRASAIRPLPAEEARLRRSSSKESNRNASIGIAEPRQGVLQGVPGAPVR